jgi:radical SAM protein with 4Fe4S-binding SPASM domain
VRRKIGGSTVETYLRKMDVKRVACPWLMRTAMIHWDGSVVQCGSDHEGKYSVGNISESSLYELWNGPLKERREKHLNNNYEFEPCTSCSDWACGISEWYLPDESS